MEPRKIYLSGKISGLPIDEARHNFNRLARYVRQVRGYDTIIINPLELNEGVDPADWKQCMYNCFEALAECDEAFFMPNWWTSDGSNIESYWCNGIGVKKTFVSFKELKKV